MTSKFHLQLDLDTQKARADGLKRMYDGVSDLFTEAQRRSVVAAAKLVEAEKANHDLRQQLREANEHVAEFRKARESEKVSVVVNAETAIRAHINDAFARGGYVSDKSDRVKKLEALLDDILVLEPHLKHYRTGSTLGTIYGDNSTWDYARVHRAAEHLRGLDALESVGYTDSEPLPDNVTRLYPTEPDCA